MSYMHAGDFEKKEAIFSFFNFSRCFLAVMYKTWTIVFFCRNASSYWGSYKARASGLHSTPSTFCNKPDVRNNHRRIFWNFLAFVVSYTNIIPYACFLSGPVSIKYKHRIKFHGQIHVSNISKPGHTDCFHFGDRTSTIR